MLLPFVVGRDMAFLLSTVRRTIVNMLPSLILKVKACTNFATNSALSAETMIVNDIDADSIFIEMFNACCGVEGKTITAAMHRQLKAALATALDLHTSNPTAFLASGVAGGFNHTVQTHKIHCTSQFFTGSDNLPLDDVQILARCSRTHHQWMGLDGVEHDSGPDVDVRGVALVRPDNRWRFARLLNRDLAIGFMRLCGYGLRSTIRAHQASTFIEAMSSFRDSINAFGCGSGKTCAFWAMPACSFATSLAMTPLELQKARLLKRLKCFES